MKQERLERRFRLRHLLSLCVFLCFLAGCGNRPAEPTGGAAAESTEGTEEKSSGSPQASEPELTEGKTVLRMSKMAAELPEGRIIQIITDEKWLYFSMQKSSEDGSVAKSFIYRCAFDGTDGKVIWQVSNTPAAPGTEETGGSNIKLIRQILNAPGGGLLIMEYSVFSSAEEYRETYSLGRLNNQGLEIWWVPLETGNSTPEAFLISEDRIAVRFGLDFVRYSAEGEYLGSCTAQEIRAVDNVYVSGDGQLYVAYGEGNAALYAAALDLETGELGKAVNLTWTTSYWNSVPGGRAGYDLLIWNTYSLTGWTIGSNELTRIVDFTGAGIDGGRVKDVLPLEPEHFLAVIQEGETETAVYEFTPEVQDGTLEKETVTLGCVEPIPSAALDRVLIFNEENPRFQIEIVDYHALYGGYSQAITQMTMDLVAGKAPDVILLNPYMPTDSYIRQGAFEDLYAWIDRDTELRREDFMTNVFQAYEDNGGLYRLVTEYSVSSYAVKTACAGEKTHWTIEEIIQLSERFPEIRVMDTYQRLLLYSAMCDTVEQYLDPDTGNCNFETDGFIQLLEWIKTFPSEDPYSDPNRDNWMYDYLIHDRDLQSFSDFFDTRWRLMDGEPITWIAFPGSEGSVGTVGSSGIFLAMNAASEKQEGAWQFMRTFLLEEYQKSSFLRGFSVRKDVLEASIEKRFSEFKSDDPDKLLEYQGNLGQPLSEEEIQRYSDLLKTANRRNTLDEGLFNLIAEEAEAFFAGQKPAEEVARIIQGRASMYIAEKAEE